jgi:thiol:disulfide interchange protein DsbD
VNVIVAALFFWFTFSLFGLYDIGLPSFITGRLTGGGPRKGYSGAFILGLLFAIVTFTCTIPIAAAILGLVASAGSRVTGVLAMFSYSLTMAAPFLVMGLFPSLIKRFQRGGGGWLHTVKVTMGFVELALGLYYLSKADLVWEWGFLTRNVMMAIYVGVLAVTSLYLLGVFRMKGDPEPAPVEPGAPPPLPMVGVGQMLVSLAFAVLAVTVGSGFTGRPIGWVDTVLPPREIVETGGLDAALAEAKRTGKPVFVEFTGVT